MARQFRNGVWITAKSSLALAAIFTLPVALSAADAIVDKEIQTPAQTKKLTEFVETYTNLYYTLGACDGFIDPSDEAPFDPYGPMLQKWPDSFKRQMSQTREDGRIESRRLAQKLKLTRLERMELCDREIENANADVQRLVVKYK